MSSKVGQAFFRAVRPLYCTNPSWRERVRSDRQYLGIERSLQRAWAKGAGLIDEEFERPMIAVVNTCQEFSPENIHLRQVGEAVKAGIRMAGGTPCEFNTNQRTGGC